MAMTKAPKVVVLLTTPSMEMETDLTTLSRPRFCTDDGYLLPRFIVAPFLREGDDMPRIEGSSGHPRYHRWEILDEENIQ